MPKNWNSNCAGLPYGFTRAQRSGMPTPPAGRMAQRPRDAGAGVTIGQGSFLAKRTQFALMKSIVRRCRPRPGALTSGASGKRRAAPDDTMGAGLLTESGTRRLNHAAFAARDPPLSACM
jgi:hypothetical protein